METHKHSIRNLDKDLILEARIHALQTGETLGELINRCIEEYLSGIEETDDDWDEVSCSPKIGQ